MKPSRSKRRKRDLGMVAARCHDLANFYADLNPCDSRTEQAMDRARSMWHRWGAWHASGKPVPPGYKQIHARDRADLIAWNYRDAGAYRRAGK